ncbi:LysR family transcriptional regulator [Paraburkholderia tuberum]|uniref:Transcriptional regulator, LysR family n=1 Tax=Paraburkholderia tuberum TaxID=157910 RepID=A0A1H1KFY7_9BURK|nr:LysR family transcriptional regulator [Paraburkholderia tuberum]SDR60890.1 transcriptional regulator, LysR family [Paraburkholderia tuberum]
MDTVQTLRIFVRVARLESFTTAADQLGLTKAYVSRSIAQLESMLRVRLLHRTSRRVVLSAAGERYRDRCERILTMLEEANAEASQAAIEASGQLRVHAMSGIGKYYVVDAIAEYRRKHPKVTFDLSFANRVPDLLDEQLDSSLIVASQLPDSNLIVHDFGRVFSVACAAPAYVAQFGAPSTPDDLQHHQCIEWPPVVGLSRTWLAHTGSKSVEVPCGSAALRVSSSDALSAAVRAGMGIGLLPMYVALSGLQTGELVRILPTFTFHEARVLSLHISRQYLDARIRTWTDHLKYYITERLQSDVERIGSESRD